MALELGQFYTVANTELILKKVQKKSLLSMFLQKNVLTPEGSNYYQRKKF
jgi:hypothetical protein